LSTMNIFIQESHANGLGSFGYHIGTIWLFIACDISLGFVGSTLKTMFSMQQTMFLNLNVEVLYLDVEVETNKTLLKKHVPH
jgi:hypothetical protein